MPKKAKAPMKLNPKSHAERLRREYTRIERRGRGKNRVVLVVKNQQFTVEPDADVRMARWMRRMLSVALDRMLNAELERIVRNR